MSILHIQIIPDFIPRVMYIQRVVQYKISKLCNVSKLLSNYKSIMYSQVDNTCKTFSE